MLATAIIFGFIVVLGAAVAWRLSTERARPPLFPYGEWPQGLQGDLPVVPEEVGPAHVGDITQ